MDLNRAFSFVFEDAEWPQLILVIGLLQLVPVVGQILALGLAIETARAVATDSPRPLPRLSRLGELFTQGLYGFLITLAYFLPLILLACVVICAAVVIAIAVGDSRDAAPAIFIPLVLCTNLLTLILALACQPLAIVGLGRYLQTGTLAGALQVGAVVATLRRDLAAWLVLFLLYILCGFIASLGAVALVIGALFTTAYSYAVFGHLLGQTLIQVSRPAVGPGLQ